MAQSTTHYERLGVRTTASYDEIKAAFRRLARMHHPDKQRQQQHLRERSQNDTAFDRQQGNPSETTMLRIQSAWECLRDVERRKRYDETLRIQQLQDRIMQIKGIEIRRSDMELVEDDESGERGYVYDCRCGDHVEVWQSELETASDLSGLQLECPGCCFVYRLSR